MNVLLIEPNAMIGAAVARQIESVGLHCELVSEVVDLAADLPRDMKRFEGVVLGSVADQISIVAALRENGYQSVVFALMESRSVRVTCDLLAAGCDDVLVKPISGLELKARLDAFLRRLSGHTKPFVSVEGLRAYFDGRDPEWGDQTIGLTGREAAIFSKLAMNAGRVVAKESIYDHVYGLSDAEPGDKVIDVYICKLRKKLLSVTGMNFIETVYGRGYKLERPSKIASDAASMAGVMAA